MSTRTAKRKATTALREIIHAARKYVEAEHEIEQEYRAERQQTDSGKSPHPRGAA